jgi:hypothetical protein
LGNSDGTFQAGQSFFAGTNPVGVTVADVNGDGRPDVVVANEGSNDVSVLLGQGSGSTWSLTYGPRLQSNGIAPVSTVVQDVNGDGIPDILVSNSGSDTVALLPGVGGGFFNDQNPVPQGTPAAAGTPVVISVGSRPGQIVALNTPSGGGFAVLDNGGHDLTELNNFNDGAFQSVLTVDTGGFNPTALVAVDVNHDGFTDLLVANANTSGQMNADGSTTGNIGLLLGGAAGFDLDETFSDVALPHPSDIALSALHGDSLFYATTLGVEKAVAFFLGSTTEDTKPTVPQLQQLPGSNVAFAVVPVPRNDVGSSEATPNDPGAKSLAGPNADALTNLLQSGRPDAGYLGSNGNSENTTDTLGRSLAPNGTLNLLLVAEGAHGDGTQARSTVQSIGVALTTWVPALTERVCASWVSFTETQQELGQQLAALASSAAKQLGVNDMALPDLPWREIGSNVADVFTDSLRPTLTAASALPTVDVLTSLAEAVRSATVVEDFMGTHVEEVEYSDGTRMPLVVSEESDAMLPDVVRLDQPALADDAPGEEREAFWLALAAGAILPLHRVPGPMAFASEEEDRGQQAWL